MENPKETEIDYESLKEYMEHEAVMDLEDKYFDAADEEMT